MGFAKIGLSVCLVKNKKKDKFAQPFYKTIHYYPVKQALSVVFGSKGYLLWLKINVNALLNVII